MNKPWYLLPDEGLIELMKTADKPLAHQIIDELTMRDDARAALEDIQLVRILNR